MKTMANVDLAKKICENCMLKNKPFPKQLYSKNCELTHCDVCPSVSVALKAMRLKDEQFAKEKQQMKDVKLTWEDVREIVAISDRMLIQKENLDDKGFFKAVLEQFKAQKRE